MSVGDDEENGLGPSRCKTLGPFIRGKIRRVLHTTRLNSCMTKLFHMYEKISHVIKGMEKSSHI